MEESKDISIQWGASGYSVLKNLNASILGVFCEFIDNSIQSYKNEKANILKIDPNYFLKIQISFDDQEIVIRDNAGGIDKSNFDRALKPGSKSLNTRGLNEFGLGMKYAAVWISNEWELTSSALGENVQRNVLFNYNEVVTKGLERLPVNTSAVDPNIHFTEVRLRLLEEKHVKNWQGKYIKEKIASVYRNFLRNKTSFHEDWAEDKIELDVLGEKLKWEEFGFLNKPLRKNIVDRIQSPNIEWKYKLDWQKANYKETVKDQDGNIKEIERKIEISGFVGILPDGNHKGKNGFVLLRRGRVIEGISERIYPTQISGRSSRAFKYIRLYGELHFRNVDVSFDKSKLSINTEKRNEVFAALAGLLKNVAIQGKNYDLIKQADAHRAKDEGKKQRSIAAVKEKNSPITLTESTVYDLQHDKSESQPKHHQTIENFVRTINLGQKDYILNTNFNDDNERDKIYTFNQNENSITININMLNETIVKLCDSSDINNFTNFISVINCLVMAEISSKAGRNEAQDIRYFFNEHFNTFYS